MRIVRARIFGFGKWTDETICFPETSPVILYGKNESGKSTLYQFVLFILFGLPPKRRKFYEPKTGGQFGGQLVLEDRETGTFTVERGADGKALCYTESGKTYDESWFNKRLGGMGRETFEAIFSFSALDLEEIKDMDDSNLSDVLLSIGLTGSKSIYQTERLLDAKLGELFKPYGKNPAMNKQLNHLEQLALELAEIKEEEAGYRAKAEEARLLEKSLEEKQTEKRRLEKERNELTKKRAVFPVLKEYQQLKEKGLCYQEEAVFPADGLQRLEAVKENLRPLESELAVLESNLNSYQESLAAAGKERIGEKNRQLLDKHLEHAKQGVIIEEKIQELKAQRTKVTQDITRRLDDLQLDLTREDLHELSLPFYTEAAWKQLKETQEKLDEEKASLEAEERGIEEERLQLTSEISRRKKASLPEDEISWIKEKLQEGNEYIQLEKLYQASANRHRELTELGEERRKRTLYLMTAGLLAAVLSFAAGLVAEEPLLFLFSMLLAVFSIGPYVLMKQHTKQLDELLEVPAEAAGKEKVPEEEIKEMERLIEMEEERRQEIKRLQSDLKKLEIKRLQAEEKKRFLHERKIRLKAQLDEQLTLYPFLAAIQARYWPDFYSRLKALLDAVREEEEIMKEIQELADKLETLETEMKEFFRNTERDVPASIHEMLVSLERLAERDNGLQERRAHLEELMEETSRKFAEMRKRISVREQEIQELLKLAEVESEEEYYQKAAYIREKAELEEKLTAKKKQLDSYFPDGSWQGTVSEQLDSFELDKRLEQTDEAYQDFQKESETIHRGLAELFAELKRLEGSESYSEKMHAFEMEKEKLQQLAREWSVLKIEKEVLAETKQVYQEKYLKKVIAHTEQLLSTMTDGRYTAVYPPEDGAPFRVLAADNTRYTAKELSQGTVNQLYVSLRLAISRVMAEGHALPFLVDDAFVHFDEVRVYRMMSMLQDVSKNQQVFVFTCKSDVQSAAEHMQMPMIEIV